MNVLFEGMSGMLDRVDEYALFARPQGISRAHRVSGRAYDVLGTSNVHRAVFEGFS